MYGIARRSGDSACTAFGGAAGLQSLGNSHPAARLYLGPHAASVVRESAPCRAAVVARDKIGKTSQATKIAQAARDLRT